MNLNDFGEPKYFVGNIVEIDYTTWIVNFKVPNLIDNLDQYPRAIPIFPHVYQLSTDDQIMIIKPTKVQNDIYFYLPITIYHQVGIWFFKNIVDLTNDGVITVRSDNIDVELTDVMTIKVGATKISIARNGDIDIQGNVNISGNLNATSEGTTTAVDMTGNLLRFENGILKNSGR